jgi:hypothetical protein
MKNSHLLMPRMGQNTPRIRTKYKKWTENTQEKRENRLRAFPVKPDTADRQRNIVFCAAVCYN